MPAGCNCYDCRLERENQALIAGADAATAERVEALNNVPGYSGPPQANAVAFKLALTPPEQKPKSARAIRKAKKAAAMAKAIAQADSTVKYNLRNWLLKKYDYCVGRTYDVMGTPDGSTKPMRDMGWTWEQVQRMTAEKVVSHIRAAWDCGFTFIDGGCNCSECRYNRRCWYQSGVDRDALVKQYFLEFYGKESADIRQGRAFRRRMRESNDVDPTMAQEQAGKAWKDGKARGGAARLVGVEVEFNSRDEGDDTAGEEWMGLWNGGDVHPDGSCGYEAVTPPLSGKHIGACLVDLCADLTRNKAGCDNSCGLHVHVDARDLGWYEMRRLLKVYGLVESLLFVLGGQSRITNSGSYCVPCGPGFSKALKCDDWKGGVIDYAFSNNIRPDKGRRQALLGIDKKGGGRYKALNILPWIAGRAFKAPDTTVEFRLHMGSHDPVQLTAWCHLLQDLVEWCAMKSDADVDALPTSAARILSIISPRSKTWLVKRIGAWRRDTNPVTTRAKQTGAGCTMPQRMVSVSRGTWSIKPKYHSEVA